MMKLPRRGSALVLTLALVGLLSLAACGPVHRLPTATVTLPGRLTPYRTSTPSLTPRASPPPGGPTSPPPTFTATATPTPFQHVLVQGDTLFGLALKYGVSLEVIKTANPSLQPNFLIVGTAVIIPIQATPAPTAAPTATPVPADLAAPVCYPTADGGLWCFVLAANDHAFSMENLSAWIALEGAHGQALGGQEAIAPLNRLPPDAALPLMAFFPAPAPLEATPSARLANSLVISEQDTRYLTATLQVESVDILAGGLQADVQGQVLLPAGARPASVIWVAVVAYDAAGLVVGVRKWVADEILQPGSRLSFAVTVYSLGPAIARVEAVVEARP